MKLLPPDEELAEAYAESMKALLEIDLQIEEIVNDKSAENLADVEDFNAEFRGLVREWDAFHQSFNTWRESDGDCDRPAALEALDQYSQDAAGLGRKVRDLPQSGFLLPIYTLMTEAADRDDAAMPHAVQLVAPLRRGCFQGGGRGAGGIRRAVAQGWHCVTGVARPSLSETRAGQKSGSPFVAYSSRPTNGLSFWTAIGPLISADQPATSISSVLNSGDSSRGPSAVTSTISCRCQ